MGSIVVIAGVAFVAVMASGGGALLRVFTSRFAHGPEERLATLGDEQHRALAHGLASTLSGKEPTEVRRASRRP